MSWKLHAINSLPNRCVQTLLGRDPCGLILVSDKLKRPSILRVLGDLTRGLNVNGINDFQYES